MPAKKTTEQFVQDARCVHGDTYDYSMVIYINSATKVQIGCIQHGIFLQTPNDHLGGHGCNKCAKIITANKKRRTNDSFIVMANETHGNKYDYSLVEYCDSLTKVSIKCSKHGVFSQTPARHLSGQGCPKCGREKANDSMRKELSDFINEAISIHGTTYDYSLVEYITTHKPVNIICKIHGNFQQTPHGHLEGRGCPNCGYECVSQKLLSNTGAFIQKAQEKYGNLYDYSFVEYISSHIPVLIVCQKHGLFSQKPITHLQYGCVQCGYDTTSEKLSYTLKEFVAKADIIHHDKYDYSKSIYVGSRSEICIKCPQHGEFWQKPVTHLRGSGCPKCGKSISNVETMWLDTVGVPNDKNHRQVLIRITDAQSKKKRIIVDGFMPETNTIYEFLGDFWHGNPSVFDLNTINAATHTTFGELYENTIERERLIKQAGYNVVSIWENEWHRIKNAM
jgi:hypothetical protein